MRKYIARLLLTVVVSIFALSSLGSVVSAQDAVLNLALNSNPPTIDPALATDTTSGAVIDNVFEGLTDVMPDGEVVPAGAESWEVSEDGLVYTFKLREDAVWSNGDPVVADDYVYGWLRVLNPDTASQRANFMYVVEGAEEYNVGGGKPEDVAIQALDDYTFEVTLKDPTVYFTELLAMYTFLPVNRTVVEANPQWAAELNEDYVSNGAFDLAEWTLNSHVVLTKSDTYWDRENVALDRVNMQITESASTLTSDYIAGNFDFLGAPYGEVSLDSIEAFKADGTLQSEPYSAVYYYTINTTDPDMANVNIRKALASAIDRQSIVDNITKGGQIPATAFVPTIIPGFEEDMNYFEDADYDQAREYLAVGLEELGKSDPSELDIALSINTSEAHAVIAQAIQENWSRELGVNVTIDNTEWQVYLDRLTQKDYQVGRIGWTGKFNDAMTYLGIFETAETGNNDTGWEDPAYTELISLATSELDEAKRLEYLKEAEAILMDAMPIIPIYFYSNDYVQKPEVQGMEYDSVGRINLKNVSLSE